MTNPNQNRRWCVRSMLAQALLILPTGLALATTVHHVARAQPAPSCTSALGSLMSEWQSVGFAEPSKPTQMTVAGRHGYTTTAGQFNFMRQEIRAGARECEAGHDVNALQHINTVRATLAHAHAI